MDFDVHGHNYQTMDFTEKSNQDNTVTIWTDVPEYNCKLGIQFTPGERLQYYTHTRVTTLWKIFQSTEGMAIADFYHRELLKEACKRYPKEFKQIQQTRKSA